MPGALRLSTPMRSLMTTYPRSAHPRRAAYRVGIELSRIPKLDRLELRAEAVTTDPPVSPSYHGKFNYYENVQRQGYTNKGYILGDWIGREAKGGQAWLTYHANARDSFEVTYLNNKTPKDFIPGGTTQNQFGLVAIHQVKPDLVLKAIFQYERWKAPVYQNGPKNDCTTFLQLDYRPKLHSRTF